MFTGKSRRGGGLSHRAEESGRKSDQAKRRKHQVQIIVNQISANWGPDSRFVLEANSTRSWVQIPARARIYQFLMKRKFNNLKLNTIIVWVYELTGLV